MTTDNATLILLLVLIVPTVFFLLLGPVCAVWVRWTERRPKAPPAPPVAAGATFTGLDARRSLSALRMPVRSAYGPCEACGLSRRPSERACRNCGKLFTR